LIGLAALGFIIPSQTVKEGSSINMSEQNPREYQKPAAEKLKAHLSPLQYYVTQESGTEQPYYNEYWETDAPGIYVDIVTGEPLFSSKDKYQSSCGWPAFSSSLDEESIKELEDKSFGRVRTEVRSRLGDTHLGHVFENDPESPNGTRYCINSASLRFIPLEKMEEEGYGHLIPEVKGGE
jgi:peptide methionine sulfoxide reductase msrA/msrB